MRITAALYQSRNRPRDWIILPEYADLKIPGLSPNRKMGWQAGLDVPATPWTTLEAMESQLWYLGRGVGPDIIRIEIPVLGYTLRKVFDLGGWLDGDQLSICWSETDADEIGPARRDSMEFLISAMETVVWGPRAASCPTLQREPPSLFAHPVTTSQPGAWNF